METKEFNQELVNQVMRLRPIDDTFFQQLATDKEVCEEMLQTFLQDKKLKVIRSTSQFKLVSLQRSIFIDALCELADGRFCNVEMQTGDGNDDLRRVRFHASLVTANHTPKGTTFAEVPNVTIIYVTEYDALGNGQLITKERHCIEENGKWNTVEDGEEIYFLNASVEEDNDISELLQLLKKREGFESSKFRKIADKVKYYKETTEGVSKMCKVMEEYGAIREKRTVIRIATNLLLEGYVIEEVAKNVELEVKEVQALYDELVAEGKIQAKA